MTLAVLTADSLLASAFSLIPTASTTNDSFVPSIQYELKSGRTGLVSRQPIVFTSIKRGGTEDFIAKLKAEFTESDGWKFIAADDDLKGSFEVTAYYVFYNGTLGGGLAFDYKPVDNDPISDTNTQLHWIQRIVSNHMRRMEHGADENRIAFWTSGNKKKQPDVPFFDIVPKTGKRSQASNRSVPPHFEYDTGKNDPENEHQWSSEVYLASASKKDPKTVTIYNGVSWGWENKITIAPSPVVRIDLKVRP